MPRRLLPLIAVSAVLALAAGTTLGKDAPKPPARPGSKAAAGARAVAIAKAMRRLDEDVATNERDMNEQHRVFTTAIAGLVFLLDPAGGKGAARADRIDACAETIGRYVEGAEKAFERAGDSGKAPPDAMSAFEWSQTTWALSAAAVFYAELHARGSRKAQAAARLKTIADLLAKSQQPDGGWGHDREGRPRIPELDIPMPGGGTRKMQYPATILSASNWAAFACGLARPVAGRWLDGSGSSVVAKAKEYYKASACIDGTYPYDPSQKGVAMGGGDVTAAARTAGSYAALRALGLAARDPALKRTADYLGKHVEDLPEGHGSAPHGVFFGAIACVWLGPEARAAFEKQVVPRILAGQDPETGALDCVCRHQFGTSCESFKNGENVSMSMMGGGAAWKTWVRAYANALNLFAVLCEKGKLKLLDGLPADAGRAPSDTTPGDPPAMK